MLYHELLQSSFVPLPLHKFQLTPETHENDVTDSSTPRFPSHLVQIHQKELTATLGTQTPTGIVSKIHFSKNINDNITTEIAWNSHNQLKVRACLSYPEFLNVTVEAEEGGAKAASRTFRPYAKIGCEHFTQHLKSQIKVDAVNGPTIEANTVANYKVLYDSL